MIYLRGIQHSEIESILQFIYLGEAKFYEDRMNEFLLVAKNLEIRELGKSVEVGGEANEAVDNGNNDESEADIYEETEKHNVHGNDDVTDSIQQEADTGALSTDSRFVCDKCETSFVHYTSLYRHAQSMHKGVKFRCEECNREFAQKVTLMRHIENIHKAVKFDCNQCDKQFTQKDNLRQHVENIHEGVKYACNRCDFQFSMQQSLTKHIKNVHNK